MSDNIEMQKEKLDLLIATDAPYSEIYELSERIDKLITKHYDTKVKQSNQSCENNSNPNTIASV